LALVRHFEFKAISLNSLFQAIQSSFKPFKMSDNKNISEVQVTGTHRAGKKFPDLHLVVPFVEVTPVDDNFGPPKVTLKVSRIDLTLGGECFNLTKIKVDMLKDLHGQLAQYVHTHYLPEKLVFSKQGITTKSTFASLLAGRAISEV
jgi:hypothetical protein